MLIDHFRCSTNEVNIDLLQDISTEGQSPSSPHPSSTSSTSNPSAQDSSSSNANHPLPLTQENLAENCGQIDSHESNQGDPPEPGACDIPSTLRDFGVKEGDLP